MLKESFVHISKFGNLAQPGIVTTESVEALTRYVKTKPQLSWDVSAGTPLNSRMETNALRRVHCIHKIQSDTIKQAIKILSIKILRNKFSLISKAFNALVFESFHGESSYDTDKYEIKIIL